MSVLEATRSKVEHALQRVRGLRAPEPAQPDVEAALGELEAILASHRNNLNALQQSAPSASVLAQHCQTTLAELYAILLNLGFLHRAQHPCNPFEAYDPLRRLAQTVIGAQTRIILSSEWNFSPHTYVELVGLPDYVFVGFPASESENALLLPLAGHEFGHSLWRRNGVGALQQPAILKELLDQIRAQWERFIAVFPFVTDQSKLTSDPAASATWQRTWLIAERQTEEMFCDLVGLRVFGESYLKAFAWLIAPGFDSSRSNYPLTKTRAKLMVRASTKWGIAHSANYPDQFLLPSTPSGFLLGLADATSEAITEGLINEVDTMISAKRVALPSGTTVARVAKQLTFGVPSAINASLPELLCAAWKLRDDPTLWASAPHLRRERERILNDLTLKSAQCLEWRARLEAV